MSGDRVCDLQGEPREQPFQGVASSAPTLGLPHLTI